ncbi:MAG: holo-ACP synthase [Clostridia bacterium]|nr:holo-ACP synthase [Clostridia bacterium]
MITGIGMDVCQITRMEEQLNNEHFLERCFAAEERDYISQKGTMAADTMAGLFAAKEALVKCLGTGFQDTKLCDIVVLHDKFGAPYYDLRGSYALHAAQRSITSLHLTITHDSGIAAAVAIAERAEK